MYSVAIVEDEPLAVNKLRRLLLDIDPNIAIVTVLESNAALKDYLSSSPDIDIIFSDISLTDGPVFDTYRHITPHCPVIFVTAYDDYLLDAFDTNGIAYLLKPYSLDKLKKSWQKFIHLSGDTKDEPKPSAITNSIEQQAVEKMQALLASLPSNNHFPERFAIRATESIYFLAVADIVYVQADGSVISAFDTNGKRHYLPFNSLQKLSEQLDSTCFFRINRSEFVQQKYISRLERYSKNAVAVYLEGTTEPLVSSQSKTAAFCKWLGI